MRTIMPDWKLMKKISRRKKMPLKTKPCHLCGASFVPEYKDQRYCKECLGVNIKKHKREVNKKWDR